MHPLKVPLKYALPDQSGWYVNLKVRRSVLEKLKAVESVVVAAPIERSKAREVIEDGMAIAALFGVPTHYTD